MHYDQNNIESIERSTKIRTRRDQITHVRINGMYRVAYPLVIHPKDVTKVTLQMAVGIRTLLENTEFTRANLIFIGTSGAAIVSSLSEKLSAMGVTFRCTQISKMKTMGDHHRQRIITSYRKYILEDEISIFVDDLIETGDTLRHVVGEINDHVIEMSRIHPDMEAQNIGHINRVRAVCVTGSPSAQTLKNARIDYAITGGLYGGTK